MTPPLPISRIILYVKDIPKVAAFYGRHFGMSPIPGDEPGWLELASPSGGATLALHQASVAQKSGSAVKIVFGVSDVREFVARGAEAGLEWGPIHSANGIEFANAKDPAGNSVQISNRGMPPPGN